VDKLIKKTVKVYPEFTSGVDGERLTVIPNSVRRSN